MAITLFITLLGSAISHASIIGDESVNGDFSNTEASPTSLGVLAEGSNEIIGSLGPFYGTDPDDTFNFSVSPGFILSEFILKDYNDGLHYDYAPFRLHSGPSTSDPMVEYILLASFGAGTDLLQFDSAPGPQPAGFYTLDIDSVIQTFNIDERSTYAIDIKVRAVPEPTTILLFGAGLVAIGALNRRRKI